MTDAVSEQYEAFPYPERDPRDEKRRLIVGSPSHPLEMDHFLWGGRRDWSDPIRILVAGGGTGDALMQLAQVLTTARRKYEITYLDLSTAARKIAEKRAKARGLKRIEFLTGSLLDAPDLGQFDYVDCCGVLHHLPDPQAGFDALSKSLKPEGGIGLMVYAPLGRSGVYPVQEAFGELFGDLPPEQKLAAARAVFDRLPDGHQFKRNPHVTDHKASAAGFYDLLLHSRDQAFTIDRLIGAMSDAGLEFLGTPHSLQYALQRFLDPVPEGLSQAREMALAEKLDGTIKVHVAYGRRADGTAAGLAKGSEEDVPHLRGIKPAQLAARVAKDGGFSITMFGTPHRLVVPKHAAPAIAAMDGRKTVAEIKKSSGVDPILWGETWPQIARQFETFGVMLYSRLLN